MDAKEFWKEFGRMCDSHLCGDCPAKDLYCSHTMAFNANKDTSIVDAVEKWLKEHPRKTRQSVFLEQYPQAHIDDNGVLWICPSMIVRSHRRDGGGCANSPENCPDCRRKFWLQEIE